MLYEKDMLEKHLVIRHFRDLLNLNDLIDYDVEVGKVTKKLQEVGWCNDVINEMKLKAASFTRYDQVIPRPIKEAGDWGEYCSSSHLKK